jgi:hypothetical protein
MIGLRYVRKIRGNVKRGKPPHVQFKDAEYTNNILESSWDLIGREVAIYANPDVGQAVRAFVLNGADDGEELGDLIAKGVWGKWPHTLEMRKAVRKRAKLVKAITEADANIAEIARKHEIPPSTLYRWLNQCLSKNDCFFSLTRESLSDKKLQFVRKLSRTEEPDDE